SRRSDWNRWKWWISVTLSMSDLASPVSVKPRSIRGAGPEPGAAQPARAAHTRVRAAARIGSERLAGRAPVAQPADGDRYQRHRDDAEDHEAQVVLDERDI